MKPASKPIASLSFWFVLLLFVAFACNYPGYQGSAPKIELTEAGGTVTGRYPFPGEAGEKVVLFTVTEAGQATFRLEGAPESETLTVDLIDEQSAGLTWQGISLDGTGALTGEEQSALEDLLNSELGGGLALVPLDVACQGAEMLSPKQVAALLVPLQMQFKYAIPNRVAEALRLMAASSCDYGDQGEDSSGTSSQILFAPSMPVPVVFGYFPFDDEGAVEKAASAIHGQVTACGSGTYLAVVDAAPPFVRFPASVPGKRINETGPCDAKCRGACGADCELKNCQRTVEHRCELDDQGRKTGYDERYLIYDCGLHEGCIEHDACYDTCNQTYGCDSWLATACMHDFSQNINLASSEINLYCDQKAILHYGLDNTYHWAYGEGPQPLREVFEYRDEEYGLHQNFRKCNIEDPTERSGPEKDVPAGVYNGAVKMEGWFLVKERMPITEVILNTVRFVVAEDGSVSGSLSLIYDAEFTTQRGNVVEINEVYEGTFSGQLLGASGTVDIVLVNQTASSGTDGSFSGEDTLDFIAEIQVSGNALTGSVGPNPGDPYFFFEATRE